MLCRMFFLSGLFTFIAAHASAQVGQQGMDPNQFGNVRVHVVYTNDHGAGMYLRVRLMNGSGGARATENFTNDQGQAEFTMVPIGNYHVIVTGDGIEETDSGEFEVDRRKTSQDLFITVGNRDSAAKQTAIRSPIVAAVNLRVPASAQKEFDAASKAMFNQEWPKAIQRLKRAISIYPQYAPAYNNMGVSYGRMNDYAKEREALEKAISLDDHFVPAFVNLAKLSLRGHDSGRAEALLENALRMDPTNAETMTLLAEAQLLNGHYDAAISSARNVHAIPHQNLAVVHYIAGRALERENRLLDALAELQAFLTEEPQGARADHVREEIVRIQQWQR
jgi:tetratricopeptide (TPR) repeat protein